MDRPTDAAEHEERLRQTRIPTRYLGATPTTYRRRHVSRTLTHPRMPPYAADVQDAFHATQHRRRLLAIFSRMMARFYDRHERHWSMGRWECTLCAKRIMAWAWAPLQPTSEEGALHEECFSRSMWEVVLHHDQLTHQRETGMPDVADEGDSLPNTAMRPAQRPSA